MVESGGQSVVPTLLQRCMLNVRDGFIGELKCPPWKELILDVTLPIVKSIFYLKRYSVMAD